MSIQPFSGSDGPMPSPETQAFWDATRAGEFLLPRCTECGKYHWYPRSFCPFCHRGVAWVPASGRGTVYASTQTGSGAAAYCLAYVTLEEGPRMLTNLVADDGRLPAPGEQVEVSLSVCRNGQMLPVFRSVRTVRESAVLLP